MTEAEISNALAKLEKLGHDVSGWETLYRDTTNGALWEVTYPHGEVHGGGPRQLRKITRFDAATKYPALIGTLSKST